MQCPRAWWVKHRVVLELCMGEILGLKIKGRNLYFRQGISYRTMYPRVPNDPNGSSNPRIRIIPQAFYNIMSWSSTSTLMPTSYHGLRQTLTLHSKLRPRLGVSSFWKGATKIDTRSYTLFHIREDSTYGSVQNNLKHVTRRTRNYLLCCHFGLVAISYIRISTYSWIGRPIWADKKLIYQRTRRVTTLLRPPLESSRRGEFRSAGSIFV